MPADDVRDFFESVDAEPSAQFSETLLGQLRAEYLRAGPDTSRDAGRATHDEEGTVIVDVLHDDPRLRLGRGPERPSGRRSRHRIAVAAAAAVLLVAVGAVVGVTRNDPAPAILVAATGTRAEAAEEVARGFLDAYGAFDADRAMNFLTERAVAAEWGSPAEFRLELELLQASGWKQTIRDQTMPEPPPGSDGCDAYKKQSAPGRLIVYCTYGYSALRSDAIGRGPYGDVYWAFVVDNGRIVSAENRIDKARDIFPDQMWEPFRRWVSSAYPQDAAAMYQDTNRSDWNWKRSAESVRLWDQHTREYVAIGAPYIARAEAICTAAHARLKDTLGPYPINANVDAHAAYEAMAAPFLEEALTELRAVPPPEAFRDQFEQAYALGDQFVRLLRGQAPAGGPGSNWRDVRHALGGQPGLSECTFNLPG